MTTVNHEQILDVPVDDAWAVLKDFAGFLDWANVPGEVEGVGLGMIRHMETPENGKWAEKLDIADDATMTYGYTLTYGAPIGMGTYTARARLEAAGDTQSSIYWTGTFEPVEGGDASAISEMLAGAYVGMSGGVEKTAKSR
ncbi:MAG: SRPBCC family protein [Proteobacteria bacterium]|nr:SRPBCC family protein [Pseudomonadota bacterium]